MKILLYLLLIFSLKACGQSADELSIEKASNKLSGIWVLEIYERDSLKRIQKEDGKKVVMKTFVKDKLIETETEGGYYVVELSFDKSGRGSHQEYFNYAHDSENFEVATCQPFVKLKKIGGEIIINMTYMLGEQEEKVMELTENKLILKNDEGIQRTFKRLK